MSDESRGDGSIPLMQQLLDSPILLLIIGVASPAIFYTLWGVMEIISIPLAP
ncbi:MAG: hypothetical protein HQ504_06010 [Rhodospirillaceae bacterium]|nr:hypothetical protein [Rhodospirillaceae bacterium]